MLTMTAQLPTDFAEPVDETPRLLVVDDEDINRELFKRIFSRDYQVTSVPTGEHALDALYEQQFDAVLLDVMLPGMSGFDVLRMIRERDETADLPVIMVSSRSQENDVVFALRLGANDYIGKPFSVEIARARVKTHVELKRMSDRRKQMIAELQEMREVQESFFRIVSHDLKGPLTNIRLGHSILRDTLSDQPDTLSLLDNLEMTVQDMQEMIRLFLDVSALQSGKLGVQYEPVSARDVLIHAAERMRFVAEKKGIKIAVLGAAGYAHADPRLLGQAVQNLLTNALKFSPAGSTVQLWGEVEEDAVVLHVLDEGPGIPPAERAHLFEMFRQLSPRSTHGENGHGLGLWIVRQLTELMGGQVTYTPPQEGGSMFNLILPMSEL